MKKRALLLLADGFEEIEAIATVDILRRGGVEVVLCSIGETALKGANGVFVLADAKIDEIDTKLFDAIVLPGGYAGTMALCENTIALETIKEFDLNGKIIAAICAAPLVLDKAGVLKDNYTCYPGIQNSINSSFFIDKNVVQSANIITSRGPGSAICFGLYILEKLVGASISEQVKDGVLARYCNE